MKYLKGFFEIISESKKARALVVGLVLLGLVPLGRKVGVNIDEDTVNKGLVMLIAYIIGQGIADNGKEAAKIAAASDETEAE